MNVVPREVMDIVVFAGIALILVLVIRNALLNRRILNLMDEQSHAIQKLSAEIFEMQNMHTEATRSVAPLAQSYARLENELQGMSAAITALRTSGPSGARDSMQQFGKEIQRTLQAKEVADFLDRQEKN